MGTEISLIARFNSLLDRKKFPVRTRRELGRKLLMLLCVLAFPSATKRESVKIPCLFPCKQGIFNRDEFAHDSPLQRGVR
jgi:hypothetical protein